MEETLIPTSEITKKAGGEGDGDGSLFKSRRIEFHPARKPFRGFVTNPNFHLETLNPTTTSSNYTNPPTTPPKSTDSLKKKSDTFEHAGLDPELCFEITVRRIGAGLENLGNTCFLNSVLQCLTYTEPFAAYLQSGKHKSSCHTAGFCAMCAIQNHVKQALQSTGRILAPKALVTNLRCISRNFRNARQEDAHEYMVNLLESMHKCCLPSGVPSESPSAYEKSLVHKIFGGRLRSQVKCMQCSYCSNTFDPFLDLSLEITRADSLHKALSHFTAREVLDGGAKQYQCQRCKQKVKALKQLTVHKAPYVLSIHLKRFGSHNPGQKIGKKVEFGPTLDLKPYVSGNYEGDLKYTLYGVLVHAGWSTHSGHYYCYVRTSSGMWHSLDDNRVVQVSEKTVMQQKAYMLFYVRDRRTLAPKKPIDVRENIIPSVSVSREHSGSVKPKAVQNGPMATGLLTSDVCNKPHVKESSILKTGKDLATERDAAPPLKNSILQSSSKSPVKAHAIREATNCPSVEEVDLQSTRPVQGSSSTLTVAVTCLGTNPKCLPQGSGPVEEPPTCSGSQSSDPKNLVFNKNDVKANTALCCKEPAKEVNDHERSISAKLLNQPDPGNKQNGERLSGEHPNQEAESNDQTLQKTRFDKPYAISCKRSKDIQNESVSHPHNLQKKLKSKKMKKGAAHMNLGSRFLMKASLSLHKKKKQKRNKHKNSQLKRLIQDNGVINSESLDPSTSVEMRTADLVSTHSNRRKRKSSPEKRGGPTSAEDVQIFKEVDLSKRMHQGAVLARCDTSRKCSSPTSEEKQQVSRELDTSSVKRGLLGNDSKTMITVTLKESSVPRWDEVEPSSFQHPISNGVPSISIGYVPDEWDEEYDRGRRKKVRSSKDAYDGSNPFQEIATEQAKLKKIKVNKTRNGNHPMRIQ